MSSPPRCYARIDLDTGGAVQQKTDRRILLDMTHVNDRHAVGAEQRDQRGRPPDRALDAGQREFPVRKIIALQIDDDQGGIEYLAVLNI